MKFSKLSQLFLVSSLGLLVAALFSACNIITIDYVYVASAAGSGSSGNGQIDIFAADGASGALRTDVPLVSSGGANPSSLAVDTAYANLYAANAGSDSIVHFAIGLDGGLTQKESASVSSAPVSIAVNAAGTYLVAVEQVPQTNTCTLTASGSITVYPLASGVIGTPAAPIKLAVPGYASDVIVPTGVTVLANNAAVFVSAFDQSAYNAGCTNFTSTANPGWVFGFTVGSNGALTQVAGSPWKAGVKPSAIVSDPTNRFVYVTDYASAQLIGYTIQDNSTLSFLANGPFRTGNEPNAIVIDPRGRFIYLTNSLDNSVTDYTIDLATGTPTAIVNTTGSAINTTDTQPVAIIVDPAIGRYVYTANYLGDSVSGFVLDPNSGALSTAQATPYPTDSKPTAIVAIPHGNHAYTVVNQ